MSKFEALAERELAKRKGDSLTKENDNDDDDSAASDAEEGWTEAKLDERSFEDGQRNTQELSAEEVALDQAELVAGLPDDTDDLELTHSRLRSLDGLHLERFAASLTKLCLRQNLLDQLVLQRDDGTQAAPLEALKELEDLDLYDNKLTAIEGIRGLSKLETLDYSFNLIKKIPADIIDTLSSLKTIYLIQNKISRIAGLDSLAPTLNSLELGGNRIRTIENVGMLTNLTELWLGKNKISKLENIDSLVNLRVLSIQSNRITKIEGLEKLTKLEEIYISHNGLTDISGLENQTQLTTLDISANRITNLTGVAHLSQLEEFWANNNQLNSLDEVRDQLAHLPELDTVYFEHNPLQKTAGPRYRPKLADILPQVKQIDATFVRRT